MRIIYINIILYTVYYTYYTYYTYYMYYICYVHIKYAIQYKCVLFTSCIIVS